MTKLILDRKEDTLSYLWTTEHLKHEFFLSLASVWELIVPTKSKAHPFCFTKQPYKSESLTVRKYYRQAREIIYLIPRWIQSPAFVIYLSDLNSRVSNEFTEYCKDSNELNVTLFLKDVAGRFFENLDYEYYHGSVMQVLKVRLKQ